MTVKVFAPAKINLTLHVTGQNPDGYHLLDSLVAFADVGDQLTVKADDHLSLDITGPMAAGLSPDEANLVLRAARLLGGDQGAAISLKKQLPLASGMGGGSSDAAATLRALCALWDQPLPGQDALLLLGADLPVCSLCKPCRMRGIGEEIQPLANWPALPAVLVNPGQAVSTPAVFNAMQNRANPPMAEVIPKFHSVSGMADWLFAQRNDMQPAACSLLPVINSVLSDLAGLPTCLLARMSGSGATCFGLFPDRQTAQDAAAQLARLRPDWWVRDTMLGYSVST